MTHWRKIGENERGEAIYRNIKTGKLAVEKDFMYLVELMNELDRIITRSR